MGNLFKIDGLLYKIATVIYNLMILNILWLIFSIPFFTIGASTTALFYVTGKILRREGYNSLIKSFWHSFKSNFKQATLIWMMLLASFIIIFINLKNIHLLGSLGKYFAPLQFVILIELLIISIYIFPLLAGYHIKTLNGIKAAFIIANRHILTTILCLGVFPALYFILMWKGFSIVFLMAIYSFWINYLIKDKLHRYAETAKKPIVSN